MFAFGWLGLGCVVLCRTNNTLKCKCYNIYTYDTHIIYVDVDTAIAKKTETADHHI